MPLCSVKWCCKNSTTSSLAKDGITFHRFPKNPKTKAAWTKATQRKDWIPGPHHVICSRHFSNDCFELTKNNRRRLFASAIPTQLLPTLGSIKDKTDDSDEEPLSSANKIQSSNEPTNSQACDQRNKTTSEKILYRRIEDLKMKLNQKTARIKKLQDVNRFLKKKVDTYSGIVEKLKDTNLIRQEEIDVHRLQRSNQMLRRKVVWLKKLLTEQKKKNLSFQQNVVWCAEEPIVEDSVDTSIKEE